MTNLSIYLSGKRNPYKSFYIMMLFFLWIRKPSNVQKMLAVVFIRSFIFVSGATCVCARTKRFCRQGSDVVRPCRNPHRTESDNTARSRKCRDLHRWPTPTGHWHTRSVWWPDAGSEDISSAPGRQSVVVAQLPLWLNGKTHIIWP